MPEVPLPDAFEWAPVSLGPAIRCRALAAVAITVSPTRAPCSARAADARRRLARVAFSMGIPARSVVRLRQVHGTRVVEPPAATGVSPCGADWDVADIATSDAAALALCVKVPTARPSCSPTGAWRRGRCSRGMARHGRRRLAGGRGSPGRRLRCGAGRHRRGHRAEHRPVLLPGRQDVRAAFEAAGGWTARSAPGSATCRLSRPARRARHRPGCERRSELLPRHLDRERRSTAGRRCAAVTDSRVAPLHVLLQRDVSFLPRRRGTSGRMIGSHPGDGR